jgi:alpha-mannosidase
MTDDSGRPVSHQVIETHEALSREGHGPDRLVFPVKLPAMGYRLYRYASLEPSGSPRAPAMSPPNPLRATRELLANELLEIRLDQATGDIISCTRVEDGLEWVGAGGWNRPHILEDRSDTWSHGVRRFEDVIGRFDAAHIRVVDAGPLQVSLLVERSYDGNQLLQQLVLRSGQPELLIRNWLSWQGQWRMIKLGFDIATSRPRAWHDVLFGSVERPCDGQEVPTQMWMDVSGPATWTFASGTEIGLTVINDGKYGCDVSGSTARLTVLRCPPYAYHLPHPFGAKSRYDWLDQGLQEFNLLLCPHTGDWRDAGVVRRAREFNAAPVLVTMHSHPGERPPADSLLRLGASDLELTAVKPAEDGKGFIVRIADRHGRGGSGSLEWLDYRFPVRLGPSEVRTYRVRPWGSRRWRLIECDMLERPGAVAAARSSRAGASS